MSNVTQILAPGAGGRRGGRELAAAGLRRAAPAGRRKAGPGKAGADARGDRAGPRGVPAAGRRRSACGNGRAAAISSRRRRKPCAASSSTTPAASGRRSAAADSARTTGRHATSPPPEPTSDLLALDEALTELAARRRCKRELVKLRYFAGLTLERRPVARHLAPHRGPPLGLRPRLAAPEMTRATRSA